MSDPLREWLIHQLGLEVQSLQPDNICLKFQNGVLIGKILQNYNVVSSTDLSLLQDREDETTKVSNFHHLKIWLNTINIPLDDNTVSRLMAGQRSEIFGLLYRLCFFLECPNNLNLTCVLQSQSLESLNTIDLPSQKRENKFVDFTYSEEQCNKKKTVCTIININKYPYFEKSDEILSAVYDEINRFERNLPEKLNNWNARGDTSSSRFLSDLKAHRKQSNIYNSWIKNTTKLHIDMNLDVRTRHNREMLREKSMPDRMTWMSECEKKMLHKVNNARFFINKRSMVSFGNEVQFDDQCKVNKKSDTISDEIKSKMEKELIERSDRREIDELRDVAKSVVAEIVVFSVGCGMYRKKFPGDVPKYVWDNWMEMLVKGRPLLNAMYEKPGRLLDPVHVADEPRAGEELKTQAVLDRKDILQHLQGMHRSETVNNSRGLGFLVYDVFTSYYELPESLMDMHNVTFGPVMGAIHCGADESTKRNVTRALVERDILPVPLDAVVEHCLNAFYREIDNAELIKLIDIDDSRKAAAADSLNLSNTDNMQENELNNLNAASINESEQSKQTQTPEKNNKYYESARIECGKTVFVNIYSGKPLPKYRLIDCVLCYIKDKQMPGGFVLMDFPREELMIFEQRLAYKHLPPFGSYDFMKEKNPTILVQFKGPDLGDIGRYKTSFTKYIKIVPFENVYDNKWDDLHKYYRSQGVLTLIQSTENNLNLDNDKIESLCSILTGKIVDLTEELDWCHELFESELSLQVQSKHQETVFQRKRLPGKSEFDFIDHIYSRKSMVSDSNQPSLEKTENVSKAESIKSKMFNVQLNGTVGKVLANFWIAMENIFTRDMEKCFHYRRILYSEQELFVTSISNFLNEILNRPSLKKNELIKRLQHDFSSIPYEALTIPDVSGQMLLAVSDAKLVLEQLTIEKIGKCRQILGNNNIESWVDKQMASMILIYKCIIQNEVDRFVNTLIFINTYMSKLYKQIIPTTLVPKHIDVVLIKDQGSRANLANAATNVEDYRKKINATIRIVSNKVKGMYSLTSDWLESNKDTQHTDASESKILHLKIWKSLVETESWRSNDQLKFIQNRFHEDFKEIEDRFIQYRVDMTQRINNRLKNELSGVERICELFKTAINEGCMVRHEIIFFEDNFYLNPDNVLFPKNPPPEPLPLLEPEDMYIITINHLETITTQLIEICPEKCISLFSLSSWLINYSKYLPQIEWFRTAPLILRSLFGSTVNYIDWSDFIIRCMELPCPSIDELLMVKQKYMQLDRQKKIDSGETHIEGTIDKAEFDFILLWYQNTLPSNPATCYRFMKCKDLLFTIFSIDGKLDYLSMLLAMCRDDRPTMGLIKAISLISGYDITIDSNNRSNNENEIRSIPLTVDTLYETLVTCLKNYMAPDNSDIEDFLSTILYTYSDVCKLYGDSFSVNELIKHDGIISLSEIGHRFNSMSISSVVNNLKQL